MVTLLFMVPAFVLISFVTGAAEASAEVRAFFIAAATVWSFAMARMVR